jgi:RIO kinase 1
MGQNREAEQMEALEAFIDDATIDEVVGTVKSGKEATVYCCYSTRHNGLVAAKVYRSHKVRQFANDAAYTSGRLRRHNRYARAIAQKSRAGREFAFAAWVNAEYETLEMLHEAGGDVPRPIARSDSVIVMEYVGDDEAPAPMLSSVDFDDVTARDAFDQIMRNVELLLAYDRIHGDLSPHNVLYHDGRVRLIDFPQAVDPRFNANALELLARDVENVCRFAARHVVAADAGRITRELWGRFLRADL